MNTVKHWNGSKWPLLPKRRLTFWNKESLACSVLASLLGSYLDHYFVGKGLYQFPHRVLPEIFSINITFTFMVLPVLTVLFLHLLSQVNKWGGAGLILFVSLFMAILEKLAERLSMFSHSNEWLHIYSFFGYLVFLSFISWVYFWLRKRRK